MATGIQTGMRTGSRAGLATGRGAAGKPPGGGGLGKFKEIWDGLGKGMKIGVMVLIALVVTGGGIAYFLTGANKDVDLYTTKLTQQDVNECAAKLTELGISHNVKITGDGIMLHPKQRARALSQLAAAGLPRHPVLTSTNAPSEGINAKTQAEAKAQRQRILEGDMTEAIRQVAGVADAFVKIATPEETYFRDDSKPTTATVMLRLTPGTQLQTQQVQGIIHLVSFSVPELDKKNVKVVDTNGIDLSANLEWDMEGGVAPNKQAEMERQKSAELSRKAQDQLDQVFGPNKTKVAVTATMKFDQTETKAKTVGGPQDQGTVVTGRQTKVEEYAKDPNGAGPSGEGAQQMSLEDEEGEQTGVPGGSGSKSNSNYRQSVESVKVAHNETTTTTVRKAPIIDRISCSVAVDNLKQDQIDKIAGLVKGAIGLDANRGDEISVVSVPFNHQMMSQADAAAMASAMNNPAAGVPQANNMMTPQMLAMMMIIPSAVLLAFFAVFLLKQHRVQVSKSQLVLDHTGSGTTSSDISDLVTDKSGRSNTVAETKVNTTEALEKLAKEKPTKVAEMLKSTWLSG